MATTISPANAQKVWVFAQNPDGTLSPATIGGGGGSGTVTSIATTAPITGGPITTTGTIGCATCTTNAAALTSGNIVNGAGGQATVDSGIASANLITSAAVITNNVLPKGNGARGLVNSSITDNGTTVSTSEEIDIGAVGTAGVLGLVGSTSGKATLTVNATASAVTLNSVLSATNITTGTVTATEIDFNAKRLISQTTPTISSGFFGTGPTIASNNGQASFRVNVGTGVAASSGVVGLASSTNNWNCQAYNLTAHAAFGTRTDDTIVSAAGSNSVTLQNISTLTGAGTNWTASDIIVCNCFAN